MNVVVPPHPVVVAIPVRDEAERIGACLTALAQQTDRAPDDIVLLVNNTTDGTIAVARETRLPPTTSLHIIDRTLPPAQANAGYARHLAMEAAAGIAGEAGVLLTTDADSRVDPDWISANLAALAAGADAVAGWVELDPADWSRIPLALHEADAQECSYDALCDEIHARLDPDPADPMPRHTQNSGASIAVTAEAYRAVGGIPNVASGEDRAFLAALRRHDARIRHALTCHVTVSGRIEGRAVGGMADTIRRRLLGPDAHLDDRLEPAMLCARRADARRLARYCFQYWEGFSALAAATMLDQYHLRRLLVRAHFGAAWETIEAASPALQRRLVPIEELPQEMAAANKICVGLRENGVLPQRRPASISDFV